MNKVRPLLKENKKIHICLVVYGILTAVLLLLKDAKPLMTWIAGVTLWIRQALAQLFNLIPLSAAELLVIAAILLVLSAIVKTVWDIVRSKHRLKLLYRRFTIALCTALAVFFFTNLFLGVTYWGESFQDKSGIIARPVSTEQLYETARFFALSVSESGTKVKRDEQGVFHEPLDEIFQSSDGIYDNLYDLFPFLFSEPTKPKSLLFSKWMSRLSFTGFYFPFTGEANINTDAPGAFLPSTIAHEQAHQRGVAFEQEANFLAVLACVSSENPVYVYSGYLLGFVNLNNALYQADKDLFNEVYALLSDEVKADLAYNNHIGSSLSLRYPKPQTPCMIRF
jgi:hypothetical protein